MKKLIKMFAVAVLLIMSGQAMAQTRGAMFLSVTSPMNDFKKFDDFNSFALTSTDATATYGGAGIGFNVGLKWYFNVGVKGLGVLLGVDGFYNGPCADLKTVYRERETSFNGTLVDGGFKYNATPKYFNVPLMLGMNYIYHFNPSFGIYVEAGAGANARIISAMETMSKNTVLGIETQVTSRQAYDGAFSFAYQAGVGIEVGKNLVIGCSFYDLGGAQVKGEETIRTKAGGNTNTQTNYNALGTVHPVMLLGRIGFCF